MEYKIELIRQCLIAMHCGKWLLALDKTFAVRKFVAFRQKCQAFSGTFGRHDGYPYHLITNFFLLLRSNWQSHPGSQIFYFIYYVGENRNKNNCFWWCLIDFGQTCQTFLSDVLRWFWSTAKIENKKVFLLLFDEQETPRCSMLDDSYHWKWAKLVLTRHTKACVRLDTDKKLIIHHFSYL